MVILGAPPPLTSFSRRGSLSALWRLAMGLFEDVLPVMNCGVLVGLWVQHLTQE